VETTCRAESMTLTFVLSTMVLKSTPLGERSYEVFQRSRLNRYCAGLPIGGISNLQIVYASTSARQCRRSASVTSADSTVFPNIVWISWLKLLGCTRVPVASCQYLREG